MSNPRSTWSHHYCRTSSSRSPTTGTDAVVGTASDQTSRALHPVSAFDHRSGTVLRQLAVDARFNEVPALRRLLDQFDLRGAVVTADALHCQKATADHIVVADGTYLLPVEGKQPSLLARSRSKNWRDLPPNLVAELGHGQQFTHTTKAMQPTEQGTEFPHARQLIQVRRTRTVFPAVRWGRKPKKAVEVV